MIVLKLKGGLGNQLFQYALGRHLAERHDTDLRFDCSYYDRDRPPYLSFALSVFDVSVKRASAADIRTAVRLGERGVDLAGQYARYVPPLASHALNYHFELQRASLWSALGAPCQWSFEPSVLDVSAGYLNGYWQTERYFSRIEDRIRREFTVTQPIEGANRRTAERIEETDAVAVHVRRGDYVAQGNALSPAYFRAAVAEIDRTVGSPTLFVFSDDIEWAETHLTFGYPTTFVDQNGAATAHEDIRLMRLCDHHVISSSTFSWWGAWLGESTDQRVVAPPTWYDRRTREIDVVPDRWTVLEL